MIQYTSDEDTSLKFQSSAKIIYPYKDTSEQSNVPHPLLNIMIHCINLLIQGISTALSYLLINLGSKLLNKGKP